MHIFTALVVRRDLASGNALSLSLCSTIVAGRGSIMLKKCAEKMRGTSPSLQRGIREEKVYDIRKNFVLFYESSVLV